MREKAFLTWLTICQVQGTPLYTKEEWGEGKTGIMAFFLISFRFLFHMYTYDIQIPHITIKYTTILVSKQQIFPHLFFLAISSCCNLCILALALLLPPIFGPEIDGAAPFAVEVAVFLAVWCWRRASMDSRYSVRNCSTSASSLFVCAAFVLVTGLDGAGASK